MSLSEADLKQAIIEALAGHTVLSLATLDDSGGETGPHSVSLMYAHRQFDIFWLSDPKSGHSGNLQKASRCAISMARQFDDFKNIMGLQMSGHGLRLDKGAEADEAFTLLKARFPFLAKFALGDLARHLGKAAVYRFRPQHITLIDNARGFGFKQTLDL